jgi:Flp pilus assembly pilin Flp
MKSKGQNLVEFSIVSAIIVIIAIIALSALGNNVFSIFSKSTDKTENYKPFAWDLPDKKSTITTPAIPAGSLGGTETNPVRDCQGSVCNIDYGTFVLSGIPENFSDFVQSNGTSGGTESIVSLLEQMASQLEDQDDIEGSQDYKDIANLGHYLATVQETIENKAKQCKTSADSYNCFKEFINQPVVTGAAPPENIEHLLPEFSDTLSYYDFTLENNFKYAQQLEYYNNQILKHVTITPENNASYAILKKLDKIKNENKYTPEMKAVTDIIYKEMEDLHKMFNASVNAINHTTAEGVPAHFSHDYLEYTESGEVIEKVYTSDYIFNGMDPIINPDTSNLTNIDSALLCNIGDNKDNLEQCK